MHSWILSQRNENKCSQRNLCMIHSTIIQFSSVAQLCLFATPRTAARQASLSITNSWSLLKLMSIKSVMSSNHLIPFSCCPQSFPASGSLPVSQLFASGGLSIGASTLASVLPMNIQGWFCVGLTGLISRLSKELLRVFPAPEFESINSSVLSLFYGSNLTWLLEKP